eukprot:CAMPEP_0205962894 /NCGR_PEP_ID=MMETSP1459-20131121/70828_1 /ASSEMBLY_ACC=CAM_ASM_001120 /TAXON_ID=41880 /ORGANISM="Pycnococcus provasolii, Strain RCC931" /LENGTH=313 /DNA_ID=CAMNT_0053335679 /DNA_START=185 /DNA_END=1128 /DNA_ORIENTATION=-
MFDRAAAADRDDGGVNAEVNVTEYQAEAGKLPSLDGNYDAYAITGSRYGSYETDEWINILKTWVREARRKDARVLGVCFGHQVIADALGGDGTVEVNAAGFEFGTYRFQPDERFVQIAEQLYDVPPPPSGSIDMFYVHGDHVKPSALNGLELENMGGTDVSPCEGLFDAKQGRFLTLQGHPEFDEATMLWAAPTSARAKVCSMRSKVASSRCKAVREFVFLFCSKQETNLPYLSFWNMHVNNNPEFDEATMLACHTSLTDKRRLPGAMPGETDSEKSDLLRRQLASCSEAPACQAWLAQLCTSFLTADVRRAE